MPDRSGTTNGQHSSDHRQPADGRLDPESPRRADPLTPHAPASATACGSANLALTCGLIGLLLPPVGVVGAVVGAVAIFRISKWPHRFGGHNRALVGLVTGSVALFCVSPFYAGVFVPRFLEWREATRRQRCAVNMEAVGAALYAYLDAHQDEGVPTLDLLAKHELITEQQLRCPSSPRDEIGYILVEPDDGQDPVWADGMIYEQPYNHRNQGGNVLFADGHADFLELDRFHELIQILTAASE